MQRLIQSDTEMDKFIPLDRRAIITLNEMVQPLIIAIFNSQSYIEIESNMEKYLSEQLFDQVITSLLGLALDDFSEIIKYSIEALRYTLESYMFNELPYVIEKGSKEIVYTREDIINFYDNHPGFIRNFPRPQEEKLFIKTMDNNWSSNEQLVNLSKEQIIGFIFATSNKFFEEGFFTYITISSDIIDNEGINSAEFVKNAVTYRLPLYQKQKEKMPYTVKMRVGTNITLINFETLDFMQGVIMYCNFMRIPNNGNGIIWEEITLYQNGITKQVII
jgi:hypothetical protein